MNSSQDNGWVLYDNDCGVCRTWVPRWEKLLNSIDLQVGTLQDEWVSDRIELPEDELMKDIQLLGTDGTLHSGANAYRYVMKRIWWLYPFYMLSVTPLLSQIFNLCYRKFADNRHHISKSCRL